MDINPTDIFRLQLPFPRPTAFIVQPQSFSHHPCRHILLSFMSSLHFSRSQLCLAFTRTTSGDPCYMPLDPRPISIADDHLRHLSLSLPSYLNAFFYSFPLSISTHLLRYSFSLKFVFSRHHRRGPSAFAAVPIPPAFSSFRFKTLSRNLLPYPIPPIHTPYTYLRHIC